MVVLDDMDIKILKLLELNGRMSHEEIAKKLNISRPAIHQRVSKLEKNKVIKGYKTDIDWNAVGQVIRAIIFINIHTLDFNKAMKEIINLKVPGLTIEECYRITGQWCIMLKIRAEKTDQLTLLHDELLKMEGMLDTFTILILSEMEREKSV